jgi:hypothetical protein
MKKSLSEGVISKTAEKPNLKQSIISKLFLKGCAFDESDKEFKKVV